MAVEVEYKTMRQWHPGGIVHVDSKLATTAHLRISNLPSSIEVQLQARCVYKVEVKKRGRSGTTHYRRDTVDRYSPWEKYQVKSIQQLTGGGGGSGGSSSSSTHGGGRESNHENDNYGNHHDHQKDEEEDEAEGGNDMTCECSICKDKGRLATLAAPACGHLIMCQECNENLDAKKCSKCNHPVDGSLVSVDEKALKGALEVKSCKRCKFLV